MQVDLDGNLTCLSPVNGFGDEMDDGVFPKIGRIRHSETLMDNMKDETTIHQPPITLSRTKILSWGREHIVLDTQCVSAPQASGGAGGRGHGPLWAMG